MSYVALGGAAIGAIGSYMSSKNGAKGQEQLQTQQNQNSSGMSSWSPHSSLLPIYGQNAAHLNQMGGMPTPFFPGRTYVGPSSATQMGVNSAMGAAMGQMPGINNTALGNYNFLSSAADVANNPYVQAMNANTTKNLNQNLTENLMPTLNQGAMGVNAMGSGRHGLAQGRAIGDTQNAIQNAITNTNMNAYSQGLGAQQSALSSTGSMLQNMLAPSNAMLGAGQAVEGYQGKALQDAMARFSHQYSEPWQRFMQTQQGLQGMQGLGTQYKSSMGNTEGSSPNPNYQSPWSSALSGAIGGGMTGYGWGQSRGMYGGAPIVGGGAQQVSGGTPTGGAPVYSIKV